MNTPISVTEDRVTVTANDTEENIRAAAGFAEAGDDVVDATPTPAKPGVDRDDETGKFKAKAEQPDAPAKPDFGGDPRKSHQAKLNQERYLRGEAERKAAALEQELQSYKQPKPAPAPVQPSQPEPGPPSFDQRYIADVKRYQAHPDAPKLDDFVALEDPYSAHQTAMAIFAADQRHAEREERASQSRYQQERAEKAQEAVAIAEERHPGFMAAFDAQDLMYPPAVLNLLETETATDPSLSAELLHHLVTHPIDAAHLAKQEHPIAAAREIGRLLAQVSANPGPDPAPVQTNAKPLIKPVRPSIMATEPPTPDNVPFSRYMQLENERERKARAR